MAFTDKLKLIIDVDTKGATSGLSSLKGKMSEAEGFFGKLKAGAGGLKDMLGSLGPGATAGLAAGGIAAAGTAAFAAVSQFEELGLAVGDLSEKTGLSTEDASRWIEVGDQMGISAETLEGVFGKLNKNIDATKFKELGVEIAHARDGTVDANQTFLNAVDRLHGIADASERTKAGIALFGKGWASVSELVATGADELKTKLGEVADVKILSPDDVKDAREFRDTMDDLKDAGQELVLTFGKALLPGITAIAHAAVDLAGDLAPIVELLGQIIELSTKIGVFKLPDASGAAAAVESAKNYKTLREEFIAGKLSAEQYQKAVSKDFATSVRASGDDILDLSGQISGLSGNLGGMSPIVADAVERQAELDKRFKDSAASAQLTGDAVAKARHAMEGLGGATPEVAGLAEAIDGLAPPMDEAATAAGALDNELTKLFGGTMDLKEGERAYIASVQDLTESLKENKGSFDDNTEAGRANKDAIDDSINSIKDQSVAMLEQGFTTQEVTDYINGHVSSLVAQSSQSEKTRAKVQEYIDTLHLTPENVETAVKLAGDEVAKQQIQSFIGELDNIPPSKASEIRALIDEGSFAEAASRLEILARNRTMTLSIETRGGAGYGPNGVPRARGGPTTAGGFYEVAEGGRSELLHEGGRTYLMAGANGSVEPMSNGGGGGSWDGGGGPVVNNYHLTVNVDHALTERDLSQMLARMRRLGFPNAA